MRDSILTGFLERQREEAAALCRDSDLVQVRPVDGPLPTRYVGQFHCRGLVRAHDGEIVEADRFAAGIWFPSDYLRRADPFEVVTWLGPANVFHPNIAERLPVICIGRLTRGTPIADIVYRLFDIITYNNVTMVESDALNRPACAWTRANRDRIPVDRRPLKRRGINLQVQPVASVPA